MARELNRDLFGDVSKTNPREGHSPTASGAWAKDPLANLPQFSVREDDWRQLVQQMEQIKRKYKEQDSKLETLSHRFTDLASGIKLRFERFMSGQQRLETMMKSGFQEVAAKYAQLSSKFNEKKIADSKVQELVDRHTQIVSNFEVKLGQMQKLISEQEMHLMASRAELKEAQREITRLKRL